MQEPEEKKRLPRGGIGDVLWRPVSAARFRLPRPWHPVLLHPGSLTARLRARCGAAFSVRVLAESPGRLGATEAVQLQLPAGALVCWREVYLCCHGQPVVYACSLLPRAALRGEWRDLVRLGSRPLGEMLFSHSRVRRGSMDIGQVRPGSPRHRALSRGLAVPPGPVWGRRSTFMLPTAPVVVSEFFLPVALDMLHA